MRNALFRLPAFAALLIGLVVPAGDSHGQFANFVTRRGDKLMDGDRELRFISVNIPNLHYLEDYLPFTGTNPWRFPDAYEIRDALTAVRQLGGKVARTYVLSVRRQDDMPGIPRHVEGPGQFNEEAFRTLDTVLQVANEVGVRIILPFVDNWRWWGGPQEYAAFRGKDREDFWTDPQIIDDLKQTIRFVVTRKNTCTGTLYKDEKAIMAWETGNELEPPFSWTREIAAFVKSLDTNHLLVEGIHAKDLSTEAIEDPNLDILSTHHYGDPAVSLEKIVSNQQMARGRKPYVIGEYGIVPTQDIRAITDTIINQGLAGGMLWSLRFRNREGGFYHHHEYNRVGAYRWPGFANGEFYDERVVLSILHDKAHQIDGMPTPRLPVPEAPLLLDITDVAAISWRGVTGAQAYIVERKEETSSEWRVIAENVDESRYQYRPIFCDETAEPGSRYSYRIRAKNESGVSGYSNSVGPVDVRSRMIIDEMENFEKVFQKDGALQLLTYRDIRKAKEDRSRLTGEEGSYVIYKAPPAASAVRVEVFSEDDGAEVQILGSEDLTTFVEMETERSVFTFGSNDYGFFKAIALLRTTLPRGTQYIKIPLNEEIQISRVEISY